MKKRLAAALLCLALLISLPVYAAEETGSGSLDNFILSQTYDGRFTDVDTSDWFYSNVVTLYELGLTNGQTATLFGVEENLTVEEAIGFAARVRSLYQYGDAEAGGNTFAAEDGDWSSRYVLYLKSLWLLDDSFDALLDTSVTRAQAAHIMSLALPEELFTEINATAVTVGYANRAYITDVTDYTPYQQDILQLYKWGIVTGSDATGSFLPDTHITRSEFAALLTRLVQPSLRVKLSWDVSSYYTATSKTYRDLVTPGTFRRSHEIGDLSAVDSNIRYMLSRGSSTLVLQLNKNDVTEASVTALMSDYLNTIRHYIEQGYNAVSCSYSAGTGRVTLRFYSSIFSESLFSTARSETLAEAIRIHDLLWENGSITPGMSEMEKARVYFTYICENCTYDYRAIENSVSHTAYSLFFMGSAVCDGYTAAYNLLLKLEGIDCTTYSTTDHIWTVATLDGQTYHIDTTWGDQSGSIRYEYFAMTEEQSLSRF